MDILYVEDNKQIANNIKRFLWLKWFEVTIVTTKKEALSLIESEKYHLLLVDIMLPDGSWLEVCKEYRKADASTPIMMITAKWDIYDKKEAYQLWVDDYLVKPFHLDEVLIRIKALLKRANIQEIYTINDITINVEDQTVCKHDEQLDITYKEFQILEYLSRYQWSTVSRSDIIDYLRWRDWFDSKYEHSLDVYIGNLRKKIGKDVIKTVKWLGYMIGEE